MQGMALDTPRGIPFSAQTAWIETILDECSRVVLPPVDPLAADSSCFDLVVPLCHHKGFRSAEFFLDETVKALKGDQNAFCRRVRSFPACASTNRLTVIATELAGEPLRLRKNGAAIRTDNIFTSSFQPPTGRDMHRALPAFLGSSARRAARTASDSELAGTALGAYFTLLTIHPFADGNGRTARSYFASVISRIEGISSFLLLGMMMMHRRQGSAFHLAAKLARMGDTAALTELFQESVVAADIRFRGALASLESDIGAEDFRAVETNVFKVRNELYSALIL